MNRLLGRALMLTGIGHALIGLILVRHPVAAMLREGIANTVRDGQFDREAAFWFLLFSPICFLLGQLVDHALERRDRWLCALVGWNLIVMGMVGALVMPVSGFWIVIAIAPLVLRAARAIDGGSEPLANVAPRSAVRAR